MFGQGGKFTRNRTARMDSNAFAIVEDLDRCPLDARLNVCAPELEGDAVIMVINLDVIIDVLCSREHKTSYVANAVMWGRVVLLSL
jgi:hypothetical protein